MERNFSMTSRERVLTTLNHQEPDRVPLFYRDVPEVEERLLRDLGLQDRKELLSYLDIDFRWVEPLYIGPALLDSETGRRRDIWGVEYQYTLFHDRAGYWEAVGHPLAKCRDPQELDDYPWPKLEWFDFSNLKEQVKAYEQYALMTAPNYCSPGIFQTPIQGLLGVEKSFLTLATDPAFFETLVARILEFQLPFIERMLEAADNRIDFFRIGDDFGSQRGLLIGRQMWRQRICPALQAMADVAKKHKAFYYQHSCGAVRELIPDLIEIGMDVLDPIQVTAKGMVPRELKAEFGERICFSGGVDEQKLLCHGSPRDVQDGVIRLLEDMARGGGFFLGPTHNFQDDIPTDNIVAMYETARQWSY